MSISITLNHQTRAKRIPLLSIIDNQLLNETNIVTKEYRKRVSYACDIRVRFPFDTNDFSLYWL